MSDATLAAPRATVSVSEAAAGLLLAGPAVLALAVLLLLPTGALLLASLTDMELGGPAVRWIGGDNYAELWRDAKFRQALGNTLVYVAAVLPASVIGGLGLAPACCMDLACGPAEWADVASMSLT